MFLDHEILLVVRRRARQNTGTNVFAEKKPGKAGSARPQWEDVRSRLSPGDTLVVSKLDRMGRDMREIMETAWSLQDLGAKLEILSGPLAGVYDPRGMGKIFFAMLAGFAEMEREMMIERTNDGLARLRPKDGTAVGGQSSPRT
jgi:DNA invertase Pin-like site-specific DNA recombinase